MIPLLSKSKTASKVIWTTSTNAARKAFDPDDVTCQYGCVVVFNFLSFCWLKLLVFEGTPFEFKSTRTFDLSRMKSSSFMVSPAAQDTMSAPFIHFHSRFSSHAGGRGNSPKKVKKS